jgi:hypothetical protein
MQKVEGSSPFSRFAQKPSKSEGFLLHEWREQEVISPTLPLGATKAWLSFVARDSTDEDARLWRISGLSRGVLQVLLRCWHGFVGTARLGAKGLSTVARLFLIAFRSLGALPGWLLG